MRDSSLDKMIEAGLASSAEFTDQLSKLFIAYRSEEGINPVGLLEKINVRLNATATLDPRTYQNLTTTLATPMDDPSAAFETAKSRLGLKQNIDTRLALEHMKYEVLASMLSFVVNTPANEKSQRIIDAIYIHGSEQDRALLTSIGKKGQTGVVNQTWQAFTGLVGMSTTPTPAQIMTTKQSKQNEMAKLLAGTPKESDNIQDALDPLINRHGYSIILASPEGKPEKGKIYLEKINSTSIKYTVLDPHGKPQEGTVSVNQLVGEGTDSQKYNRRRRIEEILRGTLEKKTCEEEILPGILNIAINAGHAHIDFSFVDKIENKNVKNIFKAVEEITFDNNNKFNTPELLKKVSHKDLPKIAAELELLTHFIFSLRYSIEVVGDTLSSDQKAILYRQLDILSTLVSQAQENIVGAMIQRLELLDPEVLKNLNPLEYDTEYYCDEKTQTVLKADKITPMPDMLARLQHISTTDIIKYLIYIAKTGNNEQCAALFKVLPDKVKTSSEFLTTWLDNKLREWKLNFPEGEKKFLLEFIVAHKNLYQSSKDAEKGEMTISQDDFVRLCILLNTINSYTNKDAMMKVLQEANSNGYFENREDYKSFCEIFSPTTAMGAALFNRLIPHLGESDSILSLIIQIKPLENDHIRMEIITKIMEQYWVKGTLTNLDSILVFTNHEKGSTFALMPNSFLEQCLEENQDLDSYIETVVRVNEVVSEMPFIAFLGNYLKPKEIQNLIGVETQEGENLEEILQNAKTHLGESNLRYASKMLKEMQKMKLIKANKEGVTDAAKAVLAITQITNNLLKNLPSYPEKSEDLAAQFADLLTELAWFKKDFGDNPHTRSALHHLLRNLCSDSNLNLLVENIEPYQREDLQFFLAALRRMEIHSELEVKPEATPSTGLVIDIEMEDNRFSTDEQNTQLVEGAFQSADAYQVLQKALAAEKTESENKAHEELPQEISRLTDVATRPGHRPIETIKIIHSCNKLSLGNNLKIKFIHFQIAVLAFLEVFKKYKPRQNLIAELVNKIQALRAGKTSDQTALDQTPLSAPDEEGIRTKPEDRPPPPTESLRPPGAKERPVPPDYQAPEPPVDGDVTPKQ